METANVWSRLRKTWASIGLKYRSLEKDVCLAENHLQQLRVCGFNNRVDEVPQRVCSLKQSCESHDRGSKYKTRDAYYINSGSDIISIPIA